MEASPVARIEPPLRVLDLFSGIGCFSLGLERVGFQAVAFCENEPFCRAVLRARWPGVQLYNDVRDLDATQLAADGIECDVVCGGFPCTDISIAGSGVGIAGRESGLWREFARIARELRPRYLIVENTSALLVRGLDTVLGDLAEIGFDAEWHCIPASHVGAPHLRDRIWIVAYSNITGLEGRRQSHQRAGQLPVGPCSPVAYPNMEGRQQQRLEEHNIKRASRAEPNRCGAPGPWAGTYANTLQQRLERKHAPGTEAWTIDRSRHERDTAGWWWKVEPRLGRVVDGCTDRMERLRALGNAAVPQIVEVIGAAILAHARIERNQAEGVL